MNIKKTNPYGVKIIQSGFKGLSNEIVEDVKTKVNNENVYEFIEKHKNQSSMIRMGVFEDNKDSKIFRLSKTVSNNSQLINIDSIKENLDISNFDFDSMTILLENDKAGLIKIERTGTDFDFLYLKNLQVGKLEVYFDTYSFLTKEFNFNQNIEESIFVIQILTYLYYGDITSKFIKSKNEIKLSSFTKFLNNSIYNITFVDSLWKQRISTEGFKVRGHFRLQPIGEGRKKRKLIWIEEFNKDGYNRKATRELQN